MGKTTGTSWFTAVKRAFRSPTKDHDPDHPKKREKRRWIFRKPTSQEPPEVPPAPGVVSDDGAAAEKRHALAAARTEQVRLATANYAATIIQTAFRGYLARRALRALKGLVKLQALVRGHNVRKQAKMTLQCMQALVRVQSRVLDQRLRLSHQGSRSSAFSDTATVWESSWYLQEMSDRRSISQSREGSSITDDWDDRPHTIEEVKAMLQHRRDAALKLNKSSSHTFSQQLRRQGRRSPSIGNEEELGERAKRPDRWRSTKPWESRGRSSTDQRDTIKTVEMDTSEPYSYLASNFKRSSLSQYQRPSSPNHHRASPNQGLRQSPVTPSPSKARPIQVRSASPRCQSSQTPSLRSNYYYSGNLAAQHHNPRDSISGSVAYTLPSYMAPTESAKARVRSQSAPRQRPSTPERERCASAAKKRLSFPVPDPYGMGMRSPSFKSVANSQFGLEQQSIYSSCYTESIAGEVSPSSTSDLRRWLR